MAALRKRARSDTRLACDLHPGSPDVGPGTSLVFHLYQGAVRLVGFVDGGWDAAAWGHRGARRLAFARGLRRDDFLSAVPSFGSRLGCFRWSPLFLGGCGVVFVGGSALLRRRFFGLSGGGVLCLGLGWLGGLVWFLAQSLRVVWLDGRGMEELCLQRLGSCCMKLARGNVQISRHVGRYHSQKAPPVHL